MEAQAKSVMVDKPAEEAPVAPAPASVGAALAADQDEWDDDAWRLRSAGDLAARPSSWSRAAASRRVAPFRLPNPQIRRITDTTLPSTTASSPSITA